MDAEADSIAPVDAAEALYESIKVFHAGETLESHPINTGRLNPVLRPYQVDATQWMLNKEKLTYPNRVVINDVTVNVPTGGILADEMGLGKTVEVLACILSHESPPVEDFPRTPRRKKKRKSPETPPPPPSKRFKKTKIQDEPQKRLSGLKSEKYAALNAWYEMSLNGSRSTQQEKIETSFQCFCKKTPDVTDLISCSKCGREQHFACANVEYDFEEYLCPWCWSQREPIKSRATLIVSPMSISDQWASEIKKHVKDPNFKVLIYNGMRERDYIQPYVLADNDVVITTYQVLTAESNYVSSEESTQRSLRHAKKYFTPTTPLTCVHWWRLCLDEAQMVEGSATKVATMTKNLLARHTWAVTGTPVQKTIHDLFGLVQIMKIEPFCESAYWNQLMYDTEMTHRFFAPILWRNSKKEVFEMLNIPPLKVLTHWLMFSPVEGYFYKTMHAECADSFLKKLSSSVSLDMPVNEVDRKKLSSLMAPLLKLRQACIHPQAVRGKYVKFKHTMTMEELMSEMLIKAKTDFTNVLRIIVSSLNGLAGLYQILSEWAKGAECYREVLRIGAEYESVTKIDTLQMIHTLHNLGELVKRHRAQIPPTLRDSQIHDECKALEEKYMMKFEAKLVKSIKEIEGVQQLINDLNGENPLGFSEWWLNVLNWADSEDLISRIISSLDNYVSDNKKNTINTVSLAKRMNNIPAVINLLAIWLADADSNRTSVIDALKKLKDIPMSDLASEAVWCHLSLKPKKNHKKLCRICKAEKILKEYEGLIFLIGKEEEDLSSVSKKKVEEIQNGEEVEIFKLNKEGNWKPSQHEHVLSVVANYAKTKKAPDDWVRESVQHVALLKAIRKEFKLLRSEWQHLSHLVGAQDEISMAKLRLRLTANEDDGTNQQSQPVIQEFEIESKYNELLAEKMTAETELKRTYGVLLYLKNLKKTDRENDPCPVCQEQLIDKWSVLNCGHCLCFDCIPSLLNISRGHMVECPMCRFRTKRSDVSYVVESKSALEEKDVQLKGSFSTKVEEVTRQLLRLISAEPEVKVIIFSTWDKVLDVIGEALQINDILFSRLGSQNKYRGHLQRFKSGPVTALLIPLKLGSKGLNLTEASHVFLVEPVLNPADELQAVGRIHRIGQTKDTFVHRFVIHKTIEERMLSSIVSNDWSDGKVKLREMYDLFQIGGTSSSEPTIVE